MEETDRPENQAGAATAPARTLTLTGVSIHPKCQTVPDSVPDRALGLELKNTPDDWFEEDQQRFDKHGGMDDVESLYILLVSTGIERRELRRRTGHACASSPIGCLSNARVARD